MKDQAGILLVEPTYFEVNYRINPWMQPDSWARAADRLGAAARLGFDQLCAALTAAGCELVVRQGQAGLPDMVFPANAAIVLDGKALMARFRHPERQREEPHWWTLFEGLREDGRLQDLCEFPVGCYQEGAGDCVWDPYRACFWAAYGQRSAPQSLPFIERYFHQEVVGLELATQRSYHMDVCLCPLADGAVLYYPPAFTASSLATLRARIPLDCLIEAGEEDVMRFGVNAVNVDSTLVVAGMGAGLRQRLGARGYNVVEVDLAPYLLSGGGAWCMTLRLDRSSPR